MRVFLWWGGGGGGCLLGGRLGGRRGCFVFSGFLKMTLTLFIKLFSSRNALHQRDAVWLPGYREKRELQVTTPTFPWSIQGPYLLSTKAPPIDLTARTPQCHYLKPRSLDRQAQRAGTQLVARMEKQTMANL